MGTSPATAANIRAPTRRICPPYCLGFLRMLYHAIASFASLTTHVKSSSRGSVSLPGSHTILGNSLGVRSLGFSAMITRCFVEQINCRAPDKRRAGSAANSPTRRQVQRSDRWFRSFQKFPTRFWIVAKHKHRALQRRHPDLPLGQGHISDVRRLEMA